jgi:hypothetical protein
MTSINHITMRRLKNQWPVPIACGAFNYFLS